MARAKYWNPTAGPDGTGAWVYADSSPMTPVDSTLTKSGWAADAKVTGQEIPKNKIIKSDTPPEDHSLLWVDMTDSSKVPHIIIDSSVSLPGQAAEGKAVRDLMVNKPRLNPNGTDGQLLRTHGDGTTEWVDNGLPTDQQVGTAVDKWLTDHPEASTTVQDGSLTRVKFSPELDGLIFGNYVTPEMFGAKGDGVTDDTEAIKKAIVSGTRNVTFQSKTYLITSTIDIPDGITVRGTGAQSSIILAGKPFIGEYMMTFKHNLTGGLLNIGFDGNYEDIKAVQFGKIGSMPIAAPGFYVSNISIFRCNLGGLIFESVVWQILVDKVSVYFCKNGVGVLIGTTDAIFSNICISNCYIGLKVTGGSNKICNVKIDWCGNATDMDITGSAGAIFDDWRSLVCNFEVQECFYNGLIINTVDKSIFSGLDINGNGRYTDGASGDLPKRGTQFIVKDCKNTIFNSVIVSNSKWCRANINISDNKYAVNNNFGIINVVDKTENDTNGEMNDIIYPKPKPKKEIDLYNCTLEKMVFADFKSHMSGSAIVDEASNSVNYKIGTGAWDDFSISGLIIPEANSQDKVTYIIKVRLKVTDDKNENVTISEKTVQLPKIIDQTNILTPFGNPDPKFNIYLNRKAPDGFYDLFLYRAYEVNTGFNTTSAKPKFIVQKFGTEGTTVDVTIDDLSIYAFDGDVSEQMSSVYQWCNFA